MSRLLSALVTVSFILLGYVHPLSLAMSGGGGGSGGSGSGMDDMLLPSSTETRLSSRSFPISSRIYSVTPSLAPISSNTLSPAPSSSITPSPAPSSSIIPSPAPSSSIVPSPATSSQLLLLPFSPSTSAFSTPLPTLPSPSPGSSISPVLSPSFVSPVSISPVLSPSPVSSVLILSVSISPVLSPSPVSSVLILSVSISPVLSPSPVSSISPALSPSPASPESSLSSPFPSSTPAPQPTTPPSKSLLAVILSELGVEGFAGALAALAVILVLLLVLCCLCCFCTCRRVKKIRRKRRLDLSTPGLSFENRGVSQHGNGVLGTKYQQQDVALLDQHPYGTGDAELAAFHYNETALDLDFGGPSQMQPSQASLANTEIFQKNTLPELSPMAYSLTAHYPFPSEDHGLYLDTLPASTLSLRQTTMLGLSLQTQESKSAQGSRLSMHGSRPSIHGSRPSIHGSRPSIHESRPSIYGSHASSMQGSRHMLYASGTSGESLLSGGRYDNDMSDKEDLSFNRLPSLLPNHSHTVSMEVPTRDSSPLPRPLVTTTSLQLGYGKKDFASLTCLANPSALSPMASPEPQLELDLEEEEEEEEREEPASMEVAPIHRKASGKRDFTALTAVAGTAKGMPEEGSSKVKKDAKKGRSKTMSRLEKLTSLDYIRQSFRIKKKKVSFLNVKTPETTPTPTKKTTPTIPKTAPTPLKKSVRKTSNGGSMFAKELPSPQRRMSIDMTFSPTEESFLRAQQGYGEHPVMGPGVGIPLPGNMGYPQLSQPTYYLQQHQYAYPPLSQQYYPQLSQSYVPLPSPYHHVTKEAPRPRDHRYQEVVTPDFSDITTPEHNRFRERSPEHNRFRERSPEPRLGSEFNEAHMPGQREFRQDYKEQSPDKFTESSVSSEPYRHPSPDSTLMGEYGGHHLGIHPEYMRSPGPYPEPFPLGSPQGYGMDGYARRGSVEPEGHARYHPLNQSGGTEADSISVDDPQHSRRQSVDDPSPYHYSLRHDPGGHSVDDPPLRHGDPSPYHYSLQHRTEARYSGFSESSASESRFGESESGKGRVSWSSEVTEYPSAN